ncbi:MAG TPA: SBBP repeat-containing protein [Pyrinomonadaceae bacterium]
MLRAHSRSFWARRLSLFALTLLVLTGCSVYLYSRNAAAAGTNGSEPAASGTIDAARVMESYANLPLRFETNQGQTDASVRFLSHGRGYSLFLTPTQAVLALGDSGKAMEGESSSKGQTNKRRRLAGPAVLRMSLVGASANPHIEGLGELPGRSNYFIGRDPQKWRTNLTGYSRVQYEGIYPGVDMVYYGKQRQLEYDFVVAPGADPHIIRLDFDGAEKIEIDEQGDLVLSLAGRQVRQHKPFMYQAEDGGRRREVSGGYVLKGDDEVGFRVGDYDASKPLIIDPVLSYSTYLGGNNSDIGDSIAVDASGNAYLTGTTTSSNFPTASALQPLLNGTRSDVFVTKLNANGSALIYSTYVGGSVSDVGDGIDVDDAGNAYVTGTTGGSASFNDFPTVNAFDSTYNGIDDVFLFKLNTSGSALIYSTYLGGINTDVAHDLAVNRLSGEAYVAGQTFSGDFPVTVGAFKTAFDVAEAFVTKFNAQGTALAYSTFIGSSSIVNDIVLDTSGNAYLTGQTISSLFPVTAGAFQTSCASCAALKADGFVTKLNPQGTALIYSTYLGGSQADVSNGITIDGSGNAYVTGQTESTSSSTIPFPTTLGAFQTTGTLNAFVTKLNTNGSALIYSTYLGGSVKDQGNSIAVDAVGNVYVTGLTRSSDFPLVNPVSSVPAPGTDNVFISALNQAGSALLFSTFFGRGEGRKIVVVNTSAHVYVTGQTFGDLPVANAIQPANGGSGATSASMIDAFATKINLSNEITAPATFNITGRVTDVSTGNGIADVTMTLTLSQNGVTTHILTTLTNASGNYSFTNLPLGQNNARIEPSKTGYSFDPTAIAFTSSNSVGGDHTANFTGIAAGTPVPLLRFSQSAYSVGEATASIAITVTRLGNTSVPVTVDFATTGGTAQAGVDYTPRSGTLSFPSGVNSRSFVINITNDSADEADETVDLVLSNPSGGGATFIGSPTAVLTIQDDDPPTLPPGLQFSQSSYTVAEGAGFIDIVVTRGGNTSLPASVRYATSDQTDANFRCDPTTPGQATINASRKCDYHIASGTLRFAPGETAKQFTLSIVNDVYVELNESLTLTLSNPTGAVLGQNSSVPVTIIDDDTAGQPNPIDDTRFFVRQLYVDLLSREPDPAGWNGWTDRINLCGQQGQPPPPCDRVTVAGDGFLRSGEFFDRQFFVLRLYRTGLGRILRYDEVGDLAFVSGFLTEAQLELNKQDLVADIMSRPEFSNRYNGLTNAGFVDALLQTAGVTVPQDVRDEWVASLNNGSKTKARVYREISERAEVSAKYLHEAQVVSAYYGFFSRNPDGAYLNFLQRLDSGEITLADLANAFVNAAEYRQRFGP